MITHKVSKPSRNESWTGEIQHCECCPCFVDVDDDGKIKPKVCNDPQTCRVWTLDELVLGCHIGLPIIGASSVRKGDRYIWIFHDKQPI